MKRATKKFGIARLCTFRTLREINYRSTIALLGAFVLMSCGEAQRGGSDAGGEILFQGTWSRRFEAGPGNIHTATYVIENEGIRYTLVGSIGNADYLVKQDEFVTAEKRYVGHDEANRHYIIFFDDVTSETLVLYKQVVESVDAGLALEMPPKDTTMNHGWNEFTKVNDSGKSP